MKISVVIPLFNKEKYIGRAIESILRQTFPADEIIIVDDGSTDKSVNEVIKFDDPRIRLIQQENSGEGASRNRGVAEAKYDLVAFLDSDDEWKTDFLLQVQRLHKNFPDCGAYATAYEVIEPGGIKRYPALDEIPPFPWIGILPYFFKVMQYSIPFCSSSVAIPKEVFNDLKGFPEGIPQGADRMMWVRLGVKYPIAFSPDRQAIIHTEVLNRASSAYLARDPVTATLIDEMLENREAPSVLREDLKDFSVSLKIQRVYHLVINGRAKEARELLQSIGQNRRYRNKKLWWWFWSRMPYSLINVIRLLRLKDRKL